MEIENKNVLFLGVGGVSMHQLAISFKSMGAKVYGYDAKENLYTQKCKECGILFLGNFKKTNIKFDLCIKTAAIKDTNKIVQLLKKQGVEILDRSKALSFLCEKFNTIIAVAGTHGKSTTAALIYHIFKCAGRRVSCHIGADIQNASFSLKDEFLIVEACEYNRSLLSLYPTVSVITNVEAEHMDSYKTIFNLRNAFITFLKRGKFRFVFFDDTTKFLGKQKNINFVSMDKSLNTQLKGDYNLKNVSLAVSVAKHFGVSDLDIHKGLETFYGIPRRFEYIGEKGGIKTYIDYAHHPTEIKSFISAFLKDKKNAAIVFQPHTYSRTKLLLKEFLEILKSLDNLVIFKEYPARESKKMGMTAKQLYRELRTLNLNVRYCETLKDLNQNLKEISAIAFVGAGDINLIAQKFIKTN